MAALLSLSITIASLITALLSSNRTIVEHLLTNEPEFVHSYNAEHSKH